MSPSVDDFQVKVLLVGADGMLGRCWEEFLIRNRVQHLAVARARTGLAQLDITDSKGVERCLSQGYDWVINCAAYTAVDAAEAEPDLARQVNDEAVRHLARCCAVFGCKLVHYSTDYVFSGSSTTPYSPDADIAPINVYGRTKADGEKHVRESNADHLLVRTSWVYAPWGRNFVLTMRHLLEARPEVRVVTDQVGRPTSVHTLVQATWALLTRQARGTFHVAETGACSWFDFAREIGRQTGAPGVVQPCSTDEFPRPAPRPAYSVLDTRSTELWVGPLPEWQEGLRQTLERIGRQ